MRTFGHLWVRVRGYPDLVVLRYDKDTIAALSGLAKPGLIGAWYLFEPGWTIVDVETNPMKAALLHQQALRQWQALPAKKKKQETQLAQAPAWVGELLTRTRLEALKLDGECDEESNAELRALPAELFQLGALQELTLLSFANCCASRAATDWSYATMLEFLRVQQLKVVAFASGMHARLSAASGVLGLDEDMLVMIAEEVLGGWSLLSEWQQEERAGVKTEAKEVMPHAREHRHYSGSGSTAT